MRSRLGIGALLAAVYESQTDSFKSIAKIGSGFSEENWIKLRKLLDQVKTARRSARVDACLTPDVWIEPKYVITVLADEITRSPMHTCSSDDQKSGLSLRFPRAIGFIREDKSPEDATTTDEIRKMYAMQKRKKI
ncbi:MAG: hypothetical protein AB1489_38850 [Acidobacteriota bacterium]